MTDAPKEIWAEPDGDDIIIHNGDPELDALIATRYLYKYIRDDLADAPAQNVRVKPLDWRHPSSANFKKGECFHARSDFSHYAVHKHIDGWWLNIDSKTYPTLETAKAAAYAHKCAAIRAELEPADPLDHPKVKTLLKAAILEAQLRAWERGRIDTPDEIEAAALAALEKPDET